MDRFKKRPTSQEAYVKVASEDADYYVRSAQFYNNIKFFYKRKWGVNFDQPRVNGVEVNLFNLYDAVTNFGGCHKVSSHERWGEVAQQVFGFEENVIGGDYCTKLIYMRYLSKFEQCESIGDIDEHEPELGSRSRTRGYSIFISSECPLSNIKKELVGGEPGIGFDRIYKGLMSGLPNEIDFCFNVCLILTTPGPNALQLDEFPNLLTLLIAHVGLFEDNQSFFSNHIQSSEANRNFVKFWSNVGITDPEVLNLMPEIKDSNLGKKDLEVFPALNDMLNDEKTLLSYEYRVTQLLNIIRNMAFEDVNKATLTASSEVFKFLLLCISSDKTVIRNGALDTFGEISAILNLNEDFLDTYNYVLLRHLRLFLFSDDRFLIIRSLEIVSGLCSLAENESLLNDFYDSEVIGRYQNLMTIQDLLVCVHVLESLYSMSETGKSICDRICAAPHLVHILVNFTTIEAPRFGQTGLQGIKVVEFQEDQSEVRASQNQFIQPRSTYQTPIQSTPQAVRVASNPQQTTSYRPHVVVNSRGEYPAHVSSSALSAQLAKPAEMSSELKVEHFSKIWIRQNCEYDHYASVDRGELYAAYVENFRYNHKILSCSLQNFVKFVKDIFPRVETKQHPVTKVSRIEGICFINSKKENNSTNPPPNQIAESNENIAPAKNPPSLVTVVEINKPNGVVYDGSSGTPHLNGNSDVKPEVIPNGQPKEQPKTNGTPTVNGIEKYSTSDEEEHMDAVDHEEVVETTEKLAEITDDEYSRDTVLNGDLKKNGKHPEIVEEPSEDSNEAGANGHEDVPQQNGVTKEITEVKGEPTPVILNGSTVPVGKKRPHSPENETNEKAPPKKTKVTKKKVNGVEKNTESSTGLEVPSTSAVVVSPSKIPVFMCEWEACTQYFHTGQTMIYHILHEHLPQSTTDTTLSLCRWPGCESTPRAKWSLITHLQDHHCNDSALNNSLKKRREVGEIVYIGQIKKKLETEIPAANHAGYSRYAAYDAIRRHAFNFLTKEITDEHEGPVTKSLRLTSCLVLRNLARNSLDARKKLRRYENYLSYLAMSRMESSTALSQCLSAIANADS